jgi:hypothetical protein
MLKMLPTFLEVLGLDEEPMGLFYTDELSFTVPFHMFQAMLQRYGESFLNTKTWATVQKKIARSKNAWGENPQ